MSKWFSAGTSTIVAAVALGFLASICAASQVPTAAKAWNPPRTSDGQPDIQGFWVADSVCLEAEVCGEEEAHILGVSEKSAAEVEESLRRTGVGGRNFQPKRVSAITDPPGGRIPYQPWALARRQEMRNRVHSPSTVREIHPEILCISGVPYLNHYNFEVVQTRGYVVMAWERTHSYRVIPLDRRPHVAPNVKLYMGDARGHWEGNTLVVDTTNLNDWSWLDRDANFHSDELSMVERFTFVDAKTISYQVTIQDPKIYTRPWTMATTIRRTDGPDHYVDAVPPSLKAFREGYERLEEACVEGERSLVHMLRGNRQ